MRDFPISSNKSNGSGWKTIRQQGKNKDRHIAQRTLEFLLPMPLLCYSAGTERADAAEDGIPISAHQPLSMRKRASFDHRPILSISGWRRTWQMQAGIKGEVKNIIKATLTATSDSGDTFTPFTSSSSGSSFSLLSVQETESWTEQVLSKSGKLVDGYFRKSPSADSYPRDNKTMLYCTQKPTGVTVARPHFTCPMRAPW